MTEQRKNTFNDLKAYEARRRRASSSKQDSTSLYWKSYQDLMKGALAETSRARRLVQGTCRAHQAYGKALAALDGKILLEEQQRQKRLPSSGRANKEKSTSSYTKSIMSEIFTANHIVTHQLLENATNMDEEIAEAITMLLKEVKKQFLAFEEMGSAVLTRLETTEMQVTGAWDRYLLKMETKDVTSPRSIGSKLSTNKNPKSYQEIAASGEVLDTWVVETQYRMAVAYQNAAWDEGSTKLDELFREVKQHEITRRIHLREFLVAFVQRQQRLFVGIPGIHISVLEDLAEKTISREEMEHDLQALVKEKIGATHEALKNGNGNLDSPLKSDLLGNATVLERRLLLGGGGVSGTGNTMEWTLSLAIMTCDAYLHFFDLDDSEYTPSTSPEMVIQGLMPNLISPTVDNLNMGKSNFSLGWSDSLTPSDSIVLAKCTMHEIDSTDLTIVEEGAGGNTASKMFGKLRDKKVQVRLKDVQKRDEFMEALMTEYQ